MWHVNRLVSDALPYFHGKSGPPGKLDIFVVQPVVRFHRINGNWHNSHGARRGNRGRGRRLCLLAFRLMDDRPLVQAIRDRAPGAFDALYDGYAGKLYRYCWFLLRNHDMTQVVLRDVLLLAFERIDDLGAPGSLRAWLYALAEAECARQSTTGGTAAGRDRDAGTRHARDAEVTAMAWHAVDTLPYLERAGLELSIAHELSPDEIGTVLGVPGRDVPRLLARGAQRLKRSLVAEILLRKTSCDCQERAELLRGSGGALTPALRDRLVAHAETCALCRPHRPREVSVVKVLDQAAAAEPPDGLRARVASSLTDPELSGYRRFIAGRAGRAGGARGPRTHGRQVVRRRKRALVLGLAACLACLAALGVLQIGGVRHAAVAAASGDWLSRFGGWAGSDGAWGPGGRVADDRPAAAPDGAATPKPTVGRPGTLPFPYVSRPGYAPGVPSGAGPSGSGGPAGPGRPMPTGGVPPDPTPSRGHLRGSPPPSTAQPTGSPGVIVSSDSLDLGRGDSAQLVVRASGGTVTWRAATSSSALSVTPSSGTLRAGRPVTVTVRVDRSAAASGTATLTFLPGDVPVTVTWSAPPTPTRSTASPSPSTTASRPSASATGTASNRAG